MINDSLFTSSSNLWRTPPKIFKYWNDIYNFTVDAAADSNNHLCNRWYGDKGERQSALIKPWNPEEVYWLNPPYSRELQSKFIKMAYDNANNGGICIALLPARTDTRMFHDYIYHNFEIEFIKGRLKFSNSKNAAPFPSMIVIFKRNL